MNLTQLTSHLNAAKLAPITLAAPHEHTHAGGGAIAITPHGARILGLFTAPASPNLYFTNPELTNPDAAAKMLAGEHVLGGDRLWIAPERGLFFKGDSLGDGVTTQPAIDPGNWLIAQSSPSSLTLSNEFSAAWLRGKNESVRGLVTRSIRTLKSPFHHFPNALPNLQYVHYTGYEIASRFTLLHAPSDHLFLGMWFLIQMVVPHGGYLYAPTAARAAITDYFEPTGDDYLRLADNHVRFKLDSVHRHKIGINSLDALGRAAFLSNPAPDGNATLLIRNFLVNPSAHYADVPLHTPRGTQDVIQSYNHYTGADGFGELEFHTPAICRFMPNPTVTDTNQLWAFTGKRDHLVPIAARLLTLPDSAFSV